MLSYTVTFPEFNVFLNTICLLNRHNHSSNSSSFIMPHFTPVWFVCNRNLAHNNQYGVGTAVAQWLRRCATNQKVAGWIPDGVTGIFHRHKILPIALWPRGRLSLWQKWVPGVFPGGKGGWCVRLTTLPPSWAIVLEPSGHLGSVVGLNRYSDLDRGCKAEEVRLNSLREQDIFILSKECTKPPIHWVTVGVLPLWKLG